MNWVLTCQRRNREKNEEGMKISLSEKEGVKSFKTRCWDHYELLGSLKPSDKNWKERTGISFL